MTDVTAPPRPDGLGRRFPKRFCNTADGKPFLRYGAHPWLVQNGAESEEPIRGTFFCFALSGLSSFSALQNGVIRNNSSVGVACIFLACQG